MPSCGPSASSEAWSGTPTATIATRLAVTAKTVSNHVSTILAKLHAADRTQAAMMARAAALGRTDR